MYSVQDQLRQAREWYKSPDRFYEFCKDILHYDLLRDHPHREICRFLRKSPGNGSWRTATNMPDDFEFNGPRKDPTITKKKHRSLFAPRGCYKSTIGAVALPLHLWTSNPELRIRIGSFVKDKALSVMDEIKGHIEKNQDFIKIFGDMSGRRFGGKWASDSIQLADPFANYGKGKLIQFKNVNSCQAFGMGVSQTGGHPDIVIYDDIVTEENYFNDEHFRQQRIWIEKAENTVLSGGELNVYGTFYDFRDVHFSKIYNNPLWDTYVRSSRQEVGNKKVYWFPEILSAEFLNEQEKNAPETFSAQYLMMPVSPSESIFKKEWVDAAITPRDEMVGVGELSFLSIYIDPAYTTNKTSDKSGIVAAGLNQDGTLAVVPFAEAARLSDLDLIDRMVELAVTWGADCIKCEEVVMKNLIYPLLQQRCEHFGYPALNYVALKRSTNEGKLFFIGSMSKFFANGSIKIAEDCHELIGQLRRMKRGKNQRHHMDLVDALAHAIRDLNPEIKPDAKIPHSDRIAKIKRDQETLEYWEKKRGNNSRVNFINAFFGG